MDGSRAHLNALFDADRALRAAEDAFLESAEEKTLAHVIAEAVSEAFKLGDPEEQEVRLMRLADLCGQVQGPETVDALLSILDHDEPSVRNEAGESLLDVAYERFKEVALGIERLLARGHEGHAMEELPFVLCEIRDPDPLPLVSRFLAHPRGEVVAAAIEALAAFGDPSAIKALEKLTDDTREVTLPDLDDATATIGDLAADAIAELEGDPQEAT
ncbi:MAG: HEAT repeat domain-containing protein [Myxococcota bacterium]|nr:HEAT repeat domain-containing protein [Myxococcota bacterium]